MMTEQALKDYLRASGYLTHDQAWEIAEDLVVTINALIDEAKRTKDED